MRMNKQPPQPEQELWPRLVLRRRDQAVIAAGVAVALAALALGWAWPQWFGNGWVDIDRAEPLAVEFKIDINTADWPEIALLPNVGEQLARRIVADRAENGPFKDVDELDRVRGIGSKTLESMRPYLLPLEPVGAD